ncbi:hypothetical protein P692DRAFT_20882469 [Suillus brevipes Sb2]|nr:hypothetical protein P692DRAFT_20882469 [Suillus brevipes Sb2]
MVIVQSIHGNLEPFQVVENRYSLKVTVHAESIKTIEINGYPSFKPPPGRTYQRLSRAAGSSKRSLSKSKDLSAQNALLHQHLETVSTEATRIGQDSLRRIEHLRNGNGRWKRRLRMPQHAEMLERINQLNILRESVPPSALTRAATRAARFEACIG